MGGTTAQPGADDGDVHRNATVSVVVRMVGELDMTTVNLAATVLDEVHRTAPGRSSIDLTEIRFFASAGLNLLLQLHKDAVHAAADGTCAWPPSRRAVLRPVGP